MAAKSLEEIAGDLASGYPTQDLEAAQQAVLRVLKAVLPALTRRAVAAREAGATSAEEVWKVIRREAEPDFQPVLTQVERPQVVYVASKFLNNRAIGTAVTEVALMAWKEKEDD